MNTPLIKVIIGLGNPGLQFVRTRHNIGFRVLDELASRCGEQWRSKQNALVAEVELHDQRVLLVKPQTYMNSSGEVVSWIVRDGTQAEQVVVVHDELELPFGKVAFKQGGSHKGHNGVRSIIEYLGPDFMRLRVGISRPVQREDVAEYVLQPFAESHEQVTQMIDTAVEMIESLFDAQ